MNLVFIGSHRVFDENNSQESDSSSDNDSIFSVQSSLLSVTTSASRSGGKDGSLIEKFAALLFGDDDLKSLILAAQSEGRIGSARMRNNFRKLLKKYAGDLKEEISPHDSALVGFVSSYSSKITRELFSKLSMVDKEAEVRTLGLIGKPHDAGDVREAVEEYLQKTPSYAEPTELTKPDNPSNPNRPNNVSKPDKPTEPDEDSDQDSIAEGDGEEEPYDGSLNYLERMERLILGSIAFQTLRRRLHAFVHPSLPSRLRDLITEWSRLDHKYHGHVTRYKLFNLWAELQYIHPHEIRFGYDEGVHHNLRKILGHCQDAVERWTGERWDWWPLPPCSRPLKMGEEIVQWKCVSSRLFGVLHS